MPEKEPLHIVTDFLSALPRAAKRLAEKKNMSEPDAVEELKKRARKVLENQPNTDKAKEQKKAKTWTEKTKKDSAGQAEAIREAQASGYSGEILRATDELKILKISFGELGKETPTFLQVDTLRYSSEAAAFALKIAQLPTELQNDPHVLYRETARLYWSTDWKAASNAKAQEIRGLLDRTFDHIAKNLAAGTGLEGATISHFDAWIDPRFDLYRTRRLQEIASPGVEPEDKKSAEHMQWRGEKILEVQHDALENLLQTYQDELDKPQNSSLKRQEELLRNLNQKLLNGKTDGRNDRQLGRMTDLNGREADPYLSHVESQRNVVQRSIETLSLEDQEKAGRIVVWTRELTERFPEVTHDEGDMIPLHEFSRDDVELILSRDPAKMKEWFSKFWQSVYSMGKEMGRVDITEQYQWKGFERLVTWLYGDSGSFILATYKEQWSNMARFDGIMKNFFQSGDIKEKYKALAFLTPLDMQYLFQNFDFSEYTHSLYTEVMMDKLNVRIAEFDVVRAELKGALSPQEINALRVHAPDLFDYDRLARGEISVGRDKLLKELQKRRGDGRAFSVELDALFQTLQQKRDLVGRGVYLRDQDMIANSSWFQELSETQQRFDYITQNLKDQSLPDRQKVLYQEEVVALTEKIRQGWREITMNPDEVRGPESRAELAAIAGYSPVEIEVRERLLKYLTKNKSTVEAQYNPPEWIVRNAVWAARNSVVGWGEALDIAAQIARAPVLDLGSELSPGGRDVMPAGFAEPILRVLNPDLFRDRFGMGGKLGDAVMDIYYPLMFERFNHELFLEKNLPKDWKARLRQAEREGKTKWHVYLAYAEEKLKIPYSEVLRTGFLHTGLHTTGSTWRPEIALLEPLRNEILAKRMANKIRPDAVLDNQALSIQFMITDPVKEFGLRKQLLGKMVMRTPSRFFQLLGKDLHDIVEAHGIKMGSPEWKTFQRALSNAQMDLWDDLEGLNVRPVDFGVRSDFDLVLKPHLETWGVTSQDQVDIYYRIITAMKNFVETPGTDGKSLLDHWASQNFPITFPLSDFNWKKARADVLPVYSNERRINDNIAMSQARDKRNDIFFTSEIISPEKPEDTLKLIKDFRKTVNFYDSTETAELNAEVVFDTFVTFNKNRAIHGPWGWIPGAVSLMRNMAEMEVERVPLLGRMKWWHTFIEEHKLAGRKIKDFPQSVAQAVSYSVRFMGPEAHAWDEFKLDRIFDHALGIGLFTENPHRAGKLRRKHRATLPWKVFYGLPRKYWPIVPAATIAVAVAHSTEEEKKSH